jgi:hypothetical protein
VERGTRTEKKWERQRIIDEIGKIEAKRLK